MLYEIQKSVRIYTDASDCRQTKGIMFRGGYAAFFVFPLTCAAEKHRIGEKPLFKRLFKKQGWYWRG